MKLGDNMAPIEACNVWNDVCPRKARPPKIGDIPRHVAVDEESPGSSTSRSVVQAHEAAAAAAALAASTKSAARSMLERPAIGKPAASPARGAFPSPLETFAKPPTAPSRRVDRVTRRPDERAETRKRSSDNDSSIVSSRIVNGPEILDEKISTAKAEKTSTLRTEPISTRPKETISTTPKETISTTLRAENISSAGETKIFHEDEIPEEIIQVRKDSALYVDAEPRDNPASSTAAIAVGRLASGIGIVDQRADDATNSRLVRPRARRESSGYFSNLGTFDEDRWTGGSSSVGATEPASQQDARDSLRRSTAKSRVSMGVGQQLPNRATGLFSPAGEENVAASSAEGDDVAVNAVKMPNIDERTSLELDRSAESDLRTDQIPSQTGETFARENNEICEALSRISLENSSSESQELKSQGDDSAAPGICKESSRDVDGGRSGKSDSSDLASQRSTSSRAAERRRSRTVVHRYSSPNMTNAELTRIAERPRGESHVASEEECPRGEIDSVVSIVGPTEDSEDDEEEDEEADDDDLVVAANLLGTSVGSGDNEADARKLLPRSIKVYQLLSTQSEDRGDGDARLYDRRISLQIPQRDDEATRGSVQQQPPRISTPTVAEHVEEKKLVHADSVPILKIPSSEATTVDNELRLCVGGRTPGSGGPTGPVIPGIRPIYPYYPYSPYASPQGSPRTNRRRPLRESRRVSIDSRQGALQLNQYKLLNNIGQGSYGIVKLAYNEEDDTHYAMKILSKKKLMKKAGIFGRIAPGRKGVANPLAKVYREIALLKKLDHPNVVKLVEVLDDPDEDNLYLVFELVQRGEVLQLPTDKPLDEETARIHFRDVVMGVEYLHYQRIVHRDIKPSNLLVDSEGRVKVADLGVSAELRAAGELLSGSAGTPAFAAPETTTPGAQYSGTLCDVWSMGVTLYSLVTGKVPWDGAGSIIGVQSAVRTEPLRFPETPFLSDDLRDLVSRMLAKDPARRINLAEIKEHPWLTRNGEEPLPNEADNCRLPVTVTDEEVARVVTRVPKLDTLILIKTMLKQHSFQNPFLPRRTVRSGCTAGEPGTSGSTLKQQVSSDTTDSSTELLPTVETLKSKTEQFHKAGRSNSAPDSYEWQTNGRQISSDSLLPPVTESSSQEQQAEVEKR